MNACIARRDELWERVLRLERAIEHVILDSPGTPDSVKGYLLRAVNGDSPGGHFETVASRAFRHGANGWTECERTGRV